MSTLRVSKYGKTKSAPVLVLLHGWGSSSKIWQPCIDELCNTFQVWCVDLPGHGENQSVNWDASVEQGLALMDEVLPQRCSIVGWSLGGLVAQLLLQRFPQRINNLMLIASAPKFIASKNWPHGMSPEKFNMFKQNFETAPQQTLKQFYVLQALHGLLAKKIIHLLEQTLTNQSMHTMSWGLQWLESIDLRNCEFSKNANLQIFQGENDQVLSVHAAEETNKIWENVNLYKVPNAGHVPFLSHPKLFYKNMQSMMRIK